ncbi:MAG TPA: hypothetical protein VLJ68_01360 [Chitinophagaceae bacterium]|nr:hypothetical protein [Chitinophagaceae bacterium]
MYDELYRYLILHKQLSIPGVGQFHLQRTPARGDFSNKRIDPPLFTISFGPAAAPPSKKIFTWLAQQLHISDREAILQFNDFAFELKKQIMNGDLIQWSGMGELSKGLSGDIHFETAKKDWSSWDPVHAEKIVRENEVHTVKVGEQEHSSTDMAAILHPPDAKKSYWWAYALIAGLAAIIYIALHFSQYGLDPSSTANQNKLIPGTSQAPYSIQ